MENNNLIAWLDVEDEIKPDAAETIKILNHMALKPVLLSGDRKAKCESLAKKIGIEEIYYEKLPAEKFQIIEEFTHRVILLW